MRCPSIRRAAVRAVRPLGEVVADHPDDRNPFSSDRLFQPGAVLMRNEEDEFYDLSVHEGEALPGLRVVRVGSTKPQSELSAK